MTIEIISRTNTYQDNKCIGELITFKAFRAGIVSSLPIGVWGQGSISVPLNELEIDANKKHVELISTQLDIPTLGFQAGANIPMIIQSLRGRMLDLGNGNYSIMDVGLWYANIPDGEPWPVDLYATIMVTDK